jgi:methyl acetate hydrolase
MAMSAMSAADAALDRIVNGDPRVPGVVAVATDRNANIYEGAAGKRLLGDDAEMTTDTVGPIFSTTKAIVATAALQLVEDGLLDLDVPAKTYAAEIGSLQVLDGFDDDGTPRLRPPKRDITTRMLLLHTAGLAYEYFNEHYARLAQRGQPSPLTGTKASLLTPLLFDPGERWEYGSNLDWVGQIIERIAGKRLGEVLAERIFAPLEMTSTAFSLTPEMRARLARVHVREADGSITPWPAFELPQDPEVQMAGHGLYSTALDFAKFMRMWLDEGAAPHGRVLARETVEMASRNGLGTLKIAALPSFTPLAHPFEVFPGMPKSWALLSMVNDEDAPTGRAAGSLAWVGMTNQYFWIDRTNGVAGFWATQLAPFADPTAVEGYLAWEKAIYDARRVASRK